MVSVIVSDPIITKFPCPILCQFLAALYFYSNQVRTIFTIHIFDLMNVFIITESTLRLEISKCSGEQYPPAARSCYISKAGTLSGLDPSTLIHN